MALLRLFSQGDQVSEADKVRPESVVMARGEVLKRGPDTINPRWRPGRLRSRFQALRCSRRLKCCPSRFRTDEDNAPEASRLKYRFLELRKEKLHSNIVLGAKVIQAIRDCMIRLGWLP